MTNKLIYNGIVLKSTGSWYSVLAEDGKEYQCNIKGNFRIKGLRSTNPVVVGDHVEFRFSPGDESGLILRIEDRHNYIIRKATKLSKVTHIIASNIDQAVVIATIAMPRTSTGFIDRFLVTAEAYHIPAIIVFNKTDLYEAAIGKKHEELVDAYSGIGYRCISVSALKGDNMDELKLSLSGKRSLLSGHSGVGKSAIINALEPALNLKTGIISDYHQKGKHTTTFAQMFPLSFGGFIIDTPGIKEFGLIDFDQAEICERFPEMRTLMHQCRYSNCSHIHEPGCAVKAALEAGAIQAFRYINYLNMVEGESWDDA